jgi:tRNA(adenine34) deaminase
MKDIYFDVAFENAKKAFDIDEVPIGAVIVKDGEIISTGYNKKESNNSIFGHAEIYAIQEAEKKLNNWRLDGCELYVTLDPCPMCASAIKQSRITNVYSALENSDDNNSSIINSIFLSDRTNPSVTFYTNLYVDKSKKLLNSFFKRHRMK